MPPECDVINYEGKQMNEQDIRTCLIELRTLVESDDQLKDVRTDDSYLLRFLYSCKFNVRWSYKRMKAYWKMVFEYPEWFKTDGPSLHKKHLQMRSKLMHGRDREGRMVYIAKLGKINAAEIGLLDAAHLDDIWIESVIDDPQVREKGLSILVDVSGTPWRLLRWATPHNIGIGIKKLELYPITDIVVHVVNTTFIMNAGIKILWPFLNSTMKDRIKFHYEDMDSLHKYICPDQLPTEYGGNINIDYDEYIDKLVERDNEIRDKLKYYSIAIKSK